MNKINLKRYERACRYYHNLTGHDHLWEKPTPENYRQANKNIKEAENYLLKVYTDFKEVERVEKEESNGKE